MRGGPHQPIPSVSATLPAVLWMPPGPATAVYFLLTGPQPRRLGHQSPPPSPTPSSRPPRTGLEGQWPSSVRALTSFPSSQDRPVPIPSVPVAAAARFATVGERAPLSPCAHSPPRPGAGQHNPRGGGGVTELVVGGLVALGGWCVPTASPLTGQGQGLGQIGKLGQPSPAGCGSQASFPSIG